MYKINSRISFEPVNSNFHFEHFSEKNGESRSSTPLGELQGSLLEESHILML